MVRVIGYGGSVDGGAGVVPGIREWSIDYTAEAVDTSGYDTGQDKTFKIGQREWSGSFGGPKNQAPLAMDGSEVTLKLFEVAADAAYDWTGQAFITSIRADSTIEGIVMYAYTFQGTGTITGVPTS